jgi:hypothetical protein
MSQDTENRKLTEGEKVVTISFNPAQNEDVKEIKAIAAQLIDKIEALAVGPDPFHIEIKKAAKLKVLDAQMMAVKAATYAL